MKVQINGEDKEVDVVLDRWAVPSHNGGDPLLFETRVAAGLYENRASSSQPSRVRRAQVLIFREDG
jgi:hypothetical protein